MKPNPHVTVGNAVFGNDLPLALIAGPCQLESRDHAFEIAGRLKEMTSALGVGFVYKTSFDKANRTSLAGKRGMGLEAALAIFADLHRELGVPILTDVHEREQCAVVAEVVDVLQIPAFLCRQTDLLVAAARTGKVVKIKKGQFLAPWDVVNIAEKVAHFGNDRLLITERGTRVLMRGKKPRMSALRSVGSTTNWPPPLSSSKSSSPSSQGRLASSSPRSSWPTGSWTPRPS